MQAYCESAVKTTLDEFVCFFVARLVLCEIGPMSNASVVFAPQRCSSSPISSPSSSSSFLTRLDALIDRLLHCSIIIISFIIIVIMIICILPSYFVFLCAPVSMLDDLRVCVSVCLCRALCPKYKSRQNTLNALTAMVMFMHDKCII